MRYILFLVIATLFFSCKSSSNRSLTDVKAPQVCTNYEEKLFVYGVMHDSYLWADLTPKLTKEELENFVNDKELLKYLKQPQDRFSFIMSKKDHDDYFDSGIYEGFGYFPSLLIDKNGTEMVNVDFVFPDSPADKVGLKRGDVIVKYDGKSYKEISENRELFDKYFGSAKIDNRVHIELLDGRELDIKKEEFEIKTVLHKSIIEQDGQKIGYLVYQSFIGTSVDELNEAFSYFKRNGVDELILDLRYNGGGFVYIANHLGALIGGDRVSGTIFNKYRYNRKYSKYNETELFEKSPKEALNLDRVFIITTQNTCSSSELVINSLKASTNGVQMIQIGKPTCGKPYAMTSVPYCNKYILPVQMESLNGDNEGGFVDGLAPKCLSVDNIRRDFGDRDEDSLASALYYIKNSRCKVKFQRGVELFKREKIIGGFRGEYGIF